MEQRTPQEPTISEAMAQLAAIEGRMHQEGAVDAEGNDLRMIKDALEKGKITPARALELAQGMANSRQNYH